MVLLSNCNMDSMPQKNAGAGSTNEGEARTTEDRATTKRRLVIVTGLSGAGKSNALQAFEDAGYFCIDNLPPRMAPAVMETADQVESDGVVLVMDIRGRRYFGEDLEQSLEAWEEDGDWERRILFIEADDPTLVRRYKESRRPHPAAENGDVLAAIRGERENLANIREKADLVVDTSGYSALDARVRFRKLAESFPGSLTVSLISFGFKHGAPLDVDMLLDVRFLPNPHYDPELRPSDRTRRAGPQRRTRQPRRRAVSGAHLRATLLSRPPVRYRRQNLLHARRRLYRRPPPLRGYSGGIGPPPWRSRSARSRPLCPPPGAGEGKLKAFFTQAIIWKPCQQPCNV